MKRLLLLFLILSLPVFGKPARLKPTPSPAPKKEKVWSDPLLVIAIMIKNEEHSIVDTLEPLVQGGIKAFLVFDTGSTDKTLELVDAFFKKYPEVKGVVKQEPFVDFSTSRNRALDLAKEAFPQSEFIFMPDAEWILHNIPELLEFCRQESETKTDTPSYLVRVLGGNLDYHSTRMIRANSPCRYIGRVHEVIVPTTPVKIPNGVYLEQRIYSKGLAQSRERWKRDRVLLEEDFIENPYDGRALFYLAQTCGCLGDLQAAYQYYRIRTTVKAWNEEDYMACFRLGEVIEELAKSDPSLEPEAIHYYLEAYNTRPTRAEPLIKIAQHYLKQEKFPLAYFYAKNASEIEYPKDDILFVDKFFYDFVRYDILGQAAWYVNEKQVGYEALQKALAVFPDAEYLKKNLTYYQ